MKKFFILGESILLMYFGMGRAFAQNITINIDPPKNLSVVEPGALITSLIGLILIIAFLAAFLYLVLGGIKWITSGGDKAGVDAARNQIQAALLGLFIVFAAWAIMMLVQNFLNITVIGGPLQLPSPNNSNLPRCSENDNVAPCIN